MELDASNRELSGQWCHLEEELKSVLEGEKLLCNDDFFL